MKQYVLRLLVMALLITVVDARAQSVSIAASQSQSAFVEEAHRQADAQRAVNSDATAMAFYQVNAPRWQLVIIQRNAPKVGTANPHYMNKVGVYPTEDACFVKLRELNEITVHAINPAAFAACVPAP